jgi:CHAT domain-containing protein
VTDVGVVVTISRVLGNQKKKKILHFARHEVFDDKRLQSAFILKKGRLSVQNLMQVDLRHAVLAFLSACQMAKGDSGVARPSHTSRRVDTVSAASWA